jgi:quercetin dioxygenase-like cupin family protein
MKTTAIDLRKTPVHLGLTAKVKVMPVFTGDMAWYETYSKLVESDGIEGRLVTLHSFDESWNSWEMHPVGEELVLCIAGEITLIQQIDDQQAATTLRPGQAVINPAGIWHTADVSASATALFITAGAGTEHRLR